MNKITIACLAVLLMMITACSSPNNKKRVVVMATGKLTVTDNNITLERTLTHNEQDLVFKQDKVTLNVKLPNGTKQFDLTDNGVYVLNLQADTLIGGLVNYGEGGRPGRITAEALEHIIDSTKQLMQGTNASDAKSTFFILPDNIKKVSAKINTKVVGTFKGIPYSNEEDETGKVPDVIKFFTIKQKRETLKDLEDQKSKIQKAE